MNAIQIRPILWGSEEYRQELQLRQAVMRIPIGLDLYKEDLSLEEQLPHFGAFCGDKLAGVVFLKPLDCRTLLVAGICVEPALQRQGIGKKLLCYAENFAKQSGFQTLALHARTTAQQFYLKLGYHLDAPDIFEEVGIPHVAMSKKL